MMEHCNVCQSKRVWMCHNFHGIERGCGKKTERGKESGQEREREIKE